MNSITEDIKMNIESYKAKYGFESQELLDRLIELLNNDKHNPYYIEQLINAYVVRFELDKAREWIKEFPLDYPKDEIEYWEGMLSLTGDISCRYVYSKVYIKGNNPSVVPEEYKKEFDEFIFGRG